ncbi:MAG: hypothetical protein GWM98_11580 [Nitrospinaceae bacterium]|nr:hypothetical protein [Nitrospinaceae bacterium]NIR55024.1 hypothetical protein [Nitrospinaceae bacterium]NIS85423.1 hypothetical protein [Nitrospinaceae bacterium]NIT82262.1 hypothetical protein [Nitrospinaceae bacterium]NIU44492.1 hypothetical protein [Nitrospinaceae bacterium]
MSRILGYLSVITMIALCGLFLWIVGVAVANGEDALKSPVDIPPINERVDWRIEQIPANLTVVYRNGLRVAYPVISSTHFKFNRVFEERGGLWYFQAKCTTFQRIVRPTPTVYRWSDDEQWQPYTVKTW